MLAIIAGRSEPTVSSTAGMSAMNSSRVGSDEVGIGSDRPVPRLSNMISRPNDGETLAELRERWDIPLRIEVAEPLVQQEDVGRALPDDLVREVEVAESGVPSLGEHRSS